MEKITIPKEYQNYLSQVLGVDKLYLSSAIEEERKDARSWITLSRFSDAVWMVFADISGEELNSDEEELLSKMLAALKIPEKQMNVFLLPENVEKVDKLKAEVAQYKKVLCLGSRAAELTSAHTKDLGSNQLVTFFNQKLTATYSISDLISKPNLKGQSWNSMKALLQS